MFDLKRPCKTCPFRRGQGENFQLDAIRLQEIIEAVSFQCHGTVDYENFNNPRLRQGAKPQQCAGLMSLLHRAGRSNTIMQIAERVSDFRAAKLDHSKVYATIDHVFVAHTGRAEPKERAIYHPLPFCDPHTRRKEPKNAQHAVAAVEDCAVGELPADCRDFVSDYSEGEY